MNIRSLYIVYKKKQLNINLNISFYNKFKKTIEY